MQGEKYIAAVATFASARGENQKRGSGLGSESRVKRLDCGSGNLRPATIPSELLTAPEIFTLHLQTTFRMIT